MKIDKRRIIPYVTVRSEGHTQTALEVDLDALILGRRLFTISFQELAQTSSPV